MTILKKLFSKIFGNDKKQALIIGLDKAGKTTMVNFLQTGKWLPEKRATRGKSYETIEFSKNLEIDLIDVGGQMQFRDMWLNELKDTKCVIFVVDSANQSRFDEAREELWKVLPNLKGRPLIVLNNKVDKKDHATESELMEELGLNSDYARKYINQVSIYSTSSKTGEGLINAFLELYEILIGEKARKTIPIDFFGIYDFNGNLVYSNLNDLDISREEIYNDLQKYDLLADKKSQRVTRNNISYLIEVSEDLEACFVIRQTDAMHIDIVDASKELLKMVAHFEADLDNVRRKQINEVMSKITENDMTILSFT